MQGLKAFVIVLAMLVISSTMVQSRVNPRLLVAFGVNGDQVRGKDMLRSDLCCRVCISPLIYAPPDWLFYARNRLSHARTGAKQKTVRRNYMVIGVMIVLM
ncbi:hypothetical protein AMTRI_Chr01g108810 [Amborella trichopoda]